MRTRTYLAFVGAFAVLGAVNVSAGERTVPRVGDRHAAAVEGEAVRWAVGVLSADPPGGVRPAQMVVRAQDAAAAAPAAPAAAEPGNLWTFLGFPNKKELAEHKAMMERMPLHKLAKAATAPLLKVVGLVPGPPPLEAPENLQSGVAALQTAAKIKEEENLAPAKIQAIKYLAKVGCGCYPDVKKALLEALEDCNEKVRREAVKALEKAECCDAEILEKLNDIAYGTDDYGQPKEPSDKVRKEAIKAVEKCTCEVPFAPEPEVEREELPPAPPAERETPMPIEQTLFDNPNGARRIRPMPQDAVPAGSLTLSPSSGVVEFVDIQSGLVEIRFDEAGTAPPGARYMVFHKYPFKLAHVGDLEIVRHDRGGVIARPVGRRSLRKISRGDEIILNQ